MYKGIYIALSGAILKRGNMDIFAQNIANINTSGYKRERLSFRDFLVPADNNITGVSDGRTMAVLSQSLIDFSQGALVKTGNPVDLALKGPGFFALEGGMYTRNGNFTIDGEGYLITQDGKKVLGDGGPVSVRGSNIIVSPSGEIQVDGISSGKLRIVDFNDRTVLKKLSGGVFATSEQGNDVEGQVSQGYLESSNVDAVRELIDMIEAHREFETYQKMIQSFDEASSRITNDLGR